MVNTRKTQPKKSQHHKSATKTRAKSHDGIISSLSFTQKIILVVIGVVFLLVVIFTIFALNFNQKYQVEAKITDLAAAYYESYFYPRAFSDDVNDGIDSAKATEFLSQFTETGLAPVTLRQLLLSTPGVTEDDKTFLLQYCDQNGTQVVYKPEVPFAHDSYHIDYSYSCNFD